MKFYAPYEIRITIDGFLLHFPNGVREVADDDKAQIKAIGKIPEEMGQVRDKSGKVVNRRRVKKKSTTKKRGVPRDAVPNK